MVQIRVVALLSMGTGVVTSVAPGTISWCSSGDTPVLTLPPRSGESAPWGADWRTSSYCCYRVLCIDIVQLSSD